MDEAKVVYELNGTDDAPAENPYERLAAGLEAFTGQDTPEPPGGAHRPEPVRRPSWPPEPGPGSADGAIRAAGGVVWSYWGQALRVVLVHRPRYDDWAFPKGKAQPGESDAACALREVLEETGLSCTLGDELPSTTYVDQRGRPKTVRYFAMQPIGGTFTPGPEVDELRWLTVDEAARLCSYERDNELLAAFAASHELPGS